MRLVVLLVAMAAFSVDASALLRPAHRGFMAFHYATPLTSAELAWYSRFDLLVTHDPLPRAQVEALHAAGTRLLLYEWSVAFYSAIATPWQTSLPPSALLNAKPLHGHLGAADLDAFYYDPASQAHERDRARALASKLDGIAYDGLFFDTTTHQSVHPDALAEFSRRHPGLDYDAAFARFMRALRAELADGVIATNQGFRSAPHLLPYVDVDVTESLITRPVNGRFELRPWLDDGDPWNSIAHLMQQLIEPAQKAWPDVRFVHLNYVDRLDDAAVASIVAIARLYDADAFVAQPSVSGGTRGEAYFEDLGVPDRRVESKTSAYRMFSRGFVAANFGSAPLAIPNPGRHEYENVITHEATRRGRIVVAPGEVVLMRRR